ncbi:hypothetical protein Ctob_000007 [Chrysochromulina tobinii]|uniref:Uncharacterized protein n=1 Tax=Chrysochromulina tobinii TaxID=1460289 RepID=A0A0M0J3K3_9EUKA|nr:hypothetical protein Ctob_000007 [Chrysochromulina tobinii]|eukprot:KOO20833.1 hypothetical protein Ctob_000007 [Chrysochromulina sp. CCMP291]
MFVHEQRVEVPLPRFQPLPLTGVSIVDAEFRRRSEMFVQEMHREFSAFSLTGLTWLEQRAKEDAQVATERAAEDAAIARRRAEEDGALAARRQRADLERRKAGTFEKEREAQETQLISRWKSKSGELQASLKEAVASYEAHKALEAQRLKEDVARASAEAARNADLEVERAIRTAEQAEEARLKAELDKLRMSTTPSVRSLTLVGAQQVAPALRYAVGVVGGPLRLKDRSWWKLLHTLECEGLTPPLKQTDLATKLFEAFDGDADGDVSTADAGYLLGLLTAGTLPALMQLQLCARVRKLAAPKTTALLQHANTMQVPTPEAIDRAVADHFGGGTQQPAENFRHWASSSAVVAPLFLPL